MAMPCLYSGAHPASKQELARPADFWKKILESGLTGSVIISILGKSTPRKDN
jgi:hypothetical protein